ncbi:hypothetical protein B0T17DRAFT_502633 [Bombardia bombarda]|uniref:Uncharacterized protein n=1 Tax=Bombardia bombarda TaxID=252184 RepID=A0AA40CF15_9PEZI|nr:hypothetical protein B0T17DRAFT_502633 [Bombardia bombarda]
MLITIQLLQLMRDNGKSHETVRIESRLSAGRGQVDKAKWTRPGRWTGRQAQGDRLPSPQGGRAGWAAAGREARRPIVSRGGCLSSRFPRISSLTASSMPPVPAIEWCSQRHGSLLEGWEGSGWSGWRGWRGWRIEVQTDDGRPMQLTPRREQLNLS